MRSRSTRAPEMPSFSTATSAPAATRRSARKSGQRWLASGVEVAPSVIESPKVTIARAPCALSTMIPLRKMRDLAVWAG